jgi:small conductance mechanosensitive channel
MDPQINAPDVTKAVENIANAEMPPTNRWIKLLGDWESWLRNGEAHGPKVIGALIVLFLGWMVAGWVSRLTYRSLKLARIDETLSRFMTKFSWWSVLVLAVVVCLSIFKVETTSFAAAIGAVGFAIGLAFQGALSNFASGIMLLVFRPYKVGDVIVVGGQTGKVDEIDLLTTTLDTPDNRRILIPNASIFGSTIENTSYHHTRRVDVTVGASYSADIDQTYEILMRAVCAIPGILSEPAPEVVLLELADSSVNWSVRGWTTTADFGVVKQRTLRAVKLALDRANIEIPFPQMDVNLRGPALASLVPNTERNAA